MGQLGELVVAVDAFEQVVHYLVTALPDEVLVGSHRAEVDPCQRALRVPPLVACDAFPVEEDVSATHAHS